jgi:hypothetical protein
MCPDTVLRYNSYAAAARTITIKGLNNSHKYNLSVYCSRLRTDGQHTKVAVGTTTITILTDNNATTPASFTNVVPAAGNIVVTLTAVTNYEYVNGFTLKDVTNSTTMAIGEVTDEMLNVAQFATDSTLTTGEIKVFPNPAHDHVSILNPTGHPLQVELFDLNGRPLMVARDILYQLDLNTGHLAQGYYILVATDEKTKQVFRKKILKL